MRMTPAGGRVSAHFHPSMGTEFHKHQADGGIVLVHFETDRKRADRFEGLLEALPELGRVRSVPGTESGVREAALMDPDIVVSDSAVDGVSAADRLHELQRSGTRARWLVHAGGLDGDGVLDLVSRGIGGVLLRSDPPSLLLEGIRSMLRGGTPISPHLTPMLVEALRRTRPGRSGPPNPLLSDREHQLVRGLARGLRYQDLAAEHSVSIETVRTHLQRAYRKLRVHSRGEAIARYMTDFGIEGLGPSESRRR